MTETDAGPSETEMTAREEPSARERLVLASASPSRRRLLENAGLVHDREIARVDEESLKESVKAEGGSALMAAEALAELKAQRVSRQRPGDLVIGADQILVCEEVWFDKPEDLEEARQHLIRLSGRTHQLATAVCLVKEGQRIWHHHEAPRLTMRSLDPAFVGRYLAEVGEAALASVGAYQLEGRGAQLFHRVEGDFFSILGLPLLPLMAFLRGRGALDG